VVALGITSASVLFYFGVKRNPANLPLGIAQLSASLAICVSFSLISKLLVYWPIFYRTGQIFVLIFIVMTFLHVDFKTSNRKWKWHDFLHSNPLLIYLIDYWHILILTLAEKKKLILLEIQDLALLAQSNQSKFLGPNFHRKFRTFIFGTYWVAQVVVLVKWIKNHASLNQHNRVWINWMLLFLTCHFFLWLPYFLSILWLDPLTSCYFANTFTVIWLLISSLSLFFFPSLLYRNTFERTSRAIHKTQMTKAGEKKIEETMHDIKKNKDFTKHFLKTGYIINEFSNDIDITVYQISKCITQYIVMKYIDFINQKRIQYCVQYLDSGNWNHCKVEAIAKERGLNNPNSFTLAFRKYKGMTPSTYLKSLNK
jgi:AraC-like DNA-binding protein